MSITIKAEFNKQTKDSKKESVQFYVKGEDEHKQELNEMTRSVVILSIEGVENKLSAEFKKSSKDAKKTVLDFEVKGDASAEKSFEFYKKAGHDVVLTITESEESIEEFEEHQKKYREGLKGNIEHDGTVNFEDENQLTFDDVKDGEGSGDPMSGVDTGDDDLPF
ncbi:hypothetical protein EJP82_00970 [Paenibacillus anaericanus]|uniref:Uncharacterized protein n=1 Tax=Paenibacillus anaericanus TaxID=170367 RepID=A0A433YFB2_9BACL|nr:hypothetical protein [Paenibacillus anaericanus]RUT48547.1 hypothetical protein EJP82_00970 [Paenibacillus anaericanus]